MLPPPAARRPIVGVMGSGTEEYADLADPLGRWLAAFGVHLLTGGGRGVMAAVGRAFHAVTPRAGLVIGIVPGEPAGDGCRGLPGYPNPWVDLPIRTHLPLSGDDGESPLSRNHLNVLTPTALVILPGGAGTASEARLAGRYGTPAIAWFGTHDVAWPLPDGMRRAADFEDVQRFVRVCAGATWTGGRTVPPVLTY